MSKILIRYAEIGLKGKNRKDFERLLINHIRQSVNPEKITLSQKQIILLVKSNLINQTIAKLKQVFGIAWFSPVAESPSHLKSIISKTVTIAKKQISSKNTFAVQAQRIDKTLPFTSQDLAIKVGQAVRIAAKAKVDLTHPSQTIYLSCYKDFTFIYFNKIQGPGGLPVGSAGKVLSLLSGGFDSIVASYLLAKRGAQVDFLHFHVFPDYNRVLDSKIKTIIDKLSQFTLSHKLYLASYLFFQMKVLDLPLSQVKQELVGFRRLMVKVGEQLAKKYGYQALVLGDSLGQVASQTMENICAVDQAVEIPVFRPLIGMDKKDIISLVRQIGLESETNKPYKDCCSIISTHPATKANMDKIKQLESAINLDQIAVKISQNVQIINL